MLKLLIITNRFVIGGPANHIADLTSGLQETFDIKIIGGVPDYGEVVNLKAFANLKNEPIVLKYFNRRFNLIDDFKSFYEIIKIIKEFKPDIVHTHMSKPGFFGRIAAKHLGVKTIVHTYHGNLFDGYFNEFISQAIIILERFLYRKSNAIITLSHQQKENIIKKLKISDSKKVNLIKIGIDKSKFIKNENSRSKFRERYSIKDEELAIGIVGRLATIKNIKLFIRGIKYLNSKGIKNIRAFIIGDGIEKQNLKDYCNEIDIDCVEFGIDNTKASIIFTSWCEDVSKAYQGLDIVALTSINEGTPYSLIEAQTSGTAIIAANAGGVSDIVVENETAFLFNTEIEFFEKLMLLVSDDNLRISMGDNGKNYAEHEFDLSNMVEMTKKLYLDLINE